MNLSKALSFLLAIILIPIGLSAQSQKLSVVDFDKKLSQEQDYQLVDVRTKEEYSEGYIKDALNIDYNSEDFDKLAEELDKSKPVYVYCLAGGRSAAAAKELEAKGFKEIYDLEGGIRKWKQAKKPLEVASKKHSPSVSKKDFDKIITEEKFVLVDFGAKWCGPCRKMEPSIDKISNDKALKLRVLKVDVDASEELSQVLNIEVLPTLHIYKNKKLVWQGEGYLSEEELRSIINKYSN
jgi:thioredoxin 1